MFSFLDLVKGVQPVRQCSSLQISEGFQDSVRQCGPRHHQREHRGRIQRHRARGRSCGIDIDGDDDDEVVGGMIVMMKLMKMMRLLEV